MLSICLALLLLTSAFASPQGGIPTPAVPNPAGYTGGFATWAHFGLGACGNVTTDQQLVVGISKRLFDTWPGATSNPNWNPVCGRTLTATYNSANVTVTVADICGGCTEPDLNFSPVAFSRIANVDMGRISPIRFTFNPTTATTSGGQTSTSTSTTSRPTGTTTSPPTTTTSTTTSRCLNPNYPECCNCGCGTTCSCPCLTTATRTSTTVGMSPRSMPQITGRP